MVIVVNSPSVPMLNGRGVPVPSVTLDTAMWVECPS